VKRTVDYTALITPVSREEVRDFRRSMKGSGSEWATVSVGQGLAAGGVLGFAVVFILAVSGMFARVGVQGLQDNPGNPVAAFFAGFPLLVAVGIIATAVGLLVRTLTGSVWATRLRLHRFAAANGLVFSPSQSNPLYPGAIFGQGDGRRVTNRLSSAEGRFLDIGNYTYSTGSGKNRTTHRWGFMALHLDRRLPHMVLDATSNNGLFGGTNLPATFARDQRLSLEGDFDKHFALYAPRQYERDALYVFTPDLMALLIDNAAPFDVEIVDDWMFVYSAKPFRSAEPAVYQRLFQIVDTVGAKTLSQTDRYVDENIGQFAANFVAPQGARLKRSFSVVGLIVTLGLVVFGLYSCVSDIVS